MGPLRPGFCWCLRPFETYDNVVNARSNMVANLEKRREESRKRQEQRKEEAEQKKLEKEIAHMRKQSDKLRQRRRSLKRSFRQPRMLPLERGDEQKKKKEEEDAVKAQEAARAKEAEEAKRKELAAKDLPTGDRSNSTFLPVLGVTLILILETMTTIGGIAANTSQADCGRQGEGESSCRSCQSRRGQADSDACRRCFARLVESWQGTLRRVRFGCPPLG
eukprot:s2364_g5.t1